MSRVTLRLVHAVAGDPSLGELRVAEANAALSAMLVGDSNPACRQAAAWALGRIGGSRSALTSAQSSEQDARVRDAIRVALAM